MRACGQSQALCRLAGRLAVNLQAGIRRAGREKDHTVLRHQADRQFIDRIRLQCDGLAELLIAWLAQPQAVLRPGCQHQGRRCGAAKLAVDADRCARRLTAQHQLAVRRFQRDGIRFQHRTGLDVQLQTGRLVTLQ